MMIGDSTAGHTESAVFRIDPEPQRAPPQTAAVLPLAAGDDLERALGQRVAVSTRSATDLTTTLTILRAL